MLVKTLSFIESESTAVITTRFLMLTTIAVSPIMNSDCLDAFFSGFIGHLIHAIDVVVGEGDVARLQTLHRMCGELERLTSGCNLLAQNVAESRTDGQRDLNGRTLRAYGCERRRDLDRNAVANGIHRYLIAVIVDVGKSSGLPVESV